MKILIFILFMLLAAVISHAQCGTTNLALGRPISVPSQIQWHEAFNAADGNLATTWYADTVTRDTAYIKVDLGQYYSMCKVNVYWDSNGRASNFLVQLSSDSINWTTVSTVTSNTAYSNSLSIAGTARYVRLWMTQRLFNWATYQIKEFEVYNTATPPAWSQMGNTGTVPGPNFLGTTDQRGLVLKTNNISRLAILTGGAVCIGSDSVANAEAKLSVKGAIYANKLKITQSTWADNVFTKGYKLLSLSKVEAYIQKNGHLPGVPSASQVIDQPLDISQTQTTLLRKVEELTLYIIEQEKRIKKLEQLVPLH